MRSTLDVSKHTASPRRLGWAGLCAAMVVAAALVAPSAVEAQEGAAADVAATDRARSLFAEGVQLVGEQQFAEAETRFREALALRAAPAIRYNLASVLFEQGEYPEAQALNEEVVADESAPAQVREAATQLRAQIAERAGWVRFDLEGGALGGTVSIDGYALADVGLEVPISAAPHVVVVTQGESEIARREVTVEQGAHRVVAISGPVSSRVEAGGGRPIDQEEWFWPAVIGGGAAVLVIVGVAVGVAVGSGTESPVQGNFMPGVLQW